MSGEDILDHDSGSFNFSYLYHTMTNHSNQFPIQSDSDLDTKYKSIYDIANRYMTPILCICGLLGNIINLFILTHSRFLVLHSGSESGSRIGLVALALSDMMLSITVLPRSFLYTAKSLFSNMGFWLIYQAYGTGLVTTFILTSTWITVALSTLRYLAICHPFWTRQMNHKMCGKIAYAIVVIISIIINIPSYFQFKIIDIEIDNELLYLIDIGYIDHTKLPGRIFQVIRLLFFIIVPAIIISFCNCSLVFALRKSYKRQQLFNVPRHQIKTRNSITLMLIIVAVTFILLVFPSEIMDFFLEFASMDNNRTEIFLLVRSFANLFQLINFSANFLIYYLFNANFRKVVKDVIFGIQPVLSRQDTQNNILLGHIHAKPTCSTSS